MPAKTETFVLRSVYLDGPAVGQRTWQKIEEEIVGSYDQAGRRASEKAKELDARFGDDHFWTVTLRGAHGDYFQLFHGRLS